MQRPFLSKQFPHHQLLFNDVTLAYFCNYKKNQSYKLSGYLHWQTVVDGD